MEPHAALEEIAYLLERERSSRYKSKAFRAAATAIAGLDDAALRDPALRRRKGIGDSTYTVIQQALAGQVPEYLAQLRDRDAGSGAAASALRGQLRGDLHAHSDWSDGLTSIDLMVEAARALGHEYQALTDHSPRLRVANGLSADRLRAQLRVVSDINAETGPEFTLLSGIEVDILEDGALDQEPELLDELDVVVASAHSKLRMERAPMTRRLVAAASSP
ncbi:MAG: PHP domain-containing protein, partial [Microbacterium sp.]|uniref:PHP domain-containing protein n=1 Tax=Microbacterium sp. TaxID=51671 RepID=UPI001AC0F94A